MDFIFEISVKKLLRKDSIYIWGKFFVGQCNQYQQKSEFLYTFTANNCYARLLNDEPSNLVFLKICNTEFDELIITFTDQNGRALEIENKVNLIFPINKY